jgi:DNA-binding beta-propeller fold protein YncE
VKTYRIWTAFLVALVFAGVCAAETVVEKWRSPTGMFKRPFCTSVNPTDGSCWVTDQGDGPDTGEVVHLAADGTELWRGGGSFDPNAVSVNESDGSCWVADHNNHEVVHLAEDGTELWRGGGFYYPTFVCVDPEDGSCWVADSGHGDLVHLSPDGVELWRGGAYGWPISLSVDAYDGSVWVANFGGSSSPTIAHLAGDGTELWNAGYRSHAASVSANATDGSCWFSCESPAGVVGHVADDGATLWEGTGFTAPHAVSVDPRDGSCWVADTWANSVVHLAEDGTQLWRGSQFADPTYVAVDTATGFCWVADSDNGQVVRLGFPVVYQIQWVPPLHDGTSVEAPGGPFKRGRRIPVKFRLLDAEGQVVPDEIAQGLVATLQVFCEMPCDQGTPTGPGDAPPDMGDQFRYEGGMFRYNLSTKDPAWIADYTYGLEILIDGSPVGEVYFSLR